MKDTLFLKELIIHPDWLPFLSDENRQLIAFIESKIIKKAFTPSADKVLRFLTVPVISANIIVLGQDPYPQPGVATGRAFEVGNLQSWSQPFPNISVKNILRAIYKAYTGEIILYGYLKEKIYTDFPVLPPGKLFEYWEKQGILLLNTSFTCEQGKPGSHQNLWMEFTKRVLSFIAEVAPHLTWFIWGNHAAKAIKDIKINNTILTMHPMMCSNVPGRENDFLYGQNNCFRQFIHEIDWTGYAFSISGEKQGKLF